MVDGKNKCENLEQIIKNSDLNLNKVNSVGSGDSSILDEIIYRGESRIYENSSTPSFYRSNNENKIYNGYQEFMRRFPNRFLNFDYSFSKLTFMQHYGLPTQLLDVTTNLLVATYFACISNSDKDGIIYISHKHNFYQNVYGNSDFTNFFADVILLNSDSIRTELISNIRNIGNDSSTDEIKGFIKLIHSTFDNKYNGLIGRNFLKEDNEFRFGNNKNLANPIMVTPSLDNNRVRAQSGLFIFQISEEYKIDLEGKIVIDKVSKNKILDELDFKFNINKATLFPDYQNTAEFIKKNY